MGNIIGMSEVSFKRVLDQNRDLIDEITPLNPSIPKGDEWRDERYDKLYGGNSMDEVIKSGNNCNEEFSKEQVDFFKSEAVRGYSISKDDEWREPEPWDNNSFKKDKLD